jgi:hypothetical protein
VLKTMIRTEAFTAEALHFSEMPAQRVLKLLSTDVHPNTAVKFLYDALLSDDDRDRFASLSWRDTVIAVDKYLSSPPTGQFTMWPDGEKKFLSE